MAGSGTCQIVGDMGCYRQHRQLSGYPVRRWQAQIQIDGNHQPLGRFQDERSAALAYDAAAVAQYGAWACRNFPDAAWMRLLGRRMVIP